MYHSLQIIPDDQPIVKEIISRNGYHVWKDQSVDTIMKAMNGINTWDDWHLIPSSRPLITVPQFKSEYIDIPGANGSIDASTILWATPLYSATGEIESSTYQDGYPTFQNRSGSVEFYVMNDYGEWYNRYSDAMDYLHGQKMKIILEDEPDYYYTGRMTVNQWRSEKNWSKITLDYNVEPFKYELFSSLEDWLWDPFSFIDGVIRTRYVSRSSGTVTTGPLKNITIYGGDTNGINIPISAKGMPIVPSVIATRTSGNGFLQVAKYKGDVKISEHYVLPDPNDNQTHEYSFYDIKFRNEEATFIVIAAPGSTYTVSVDYRGGRL